MSSESEKIFTSIVKKQTKDGLTLMEAVVEFCQDNDIEPEDLIKKFDPVVIELIKKSAISDNMIQKKHRPNKIRELPFV